MRVRAAVVGLLLAGLAGSTPAGAANFGVNSTGDAADQTLGDGSCWTGGFVFVGMFLFPECTFRAALEETEALPSDDTITFGSIPTAAGFATLTPMSRYPPILGGGDLDIDGTTAPGYAVGDPGATPVVQIDANNVGSGNRGLSVSGDRKIVRALAIYGAPGTGLYLGSGDALVEGCHIGLSVGVLVDGSGDDGIWLNGAGTIGESCEPVVGCSGRRNVIVASGDDGIQVSGFVGSTVIAGNRIGTNAAGTSLSSGLSSTSNQGYGVRAEFTGDDITIGDLGTVGATPVASGNVISGNLTGGIYLGVEPATVVANQIGSDVTGMSALGSQPIGIEVESDGNVIGSPGVGANVIAAVTHAIRMGDTTNSSLNWIEGNTIGVNAAHTGPLGSAGFSILSSSGLVNTITGNTVGVGDLVINSDRDEITSNYIGTTAGGVDVGTLSFGIQANGEDAIISGNTLGFHNFAGILVNGPRVEVTGNFVGTDVLGRDLGGVESGVWVQTLDAVIGSDVAEPDGTVPGRGNVIAFNGAKGIRVSSGSSSSLRGNVIRDNGGIGIDLANDGATPNDPGDGDDGANHLQNFPVLDAGATSYNPALDQLSTSYFVDSTPGANATYPLAIDFYLDDGGGQAAMWLGSDVYAAIDAGSPVAATFTVPSGVIVGGSQILATATDSSAGVGSTSELGAPVAVPEPGVVLGIGAGAALLALLRRNRFA